MVIFSEESSGDNDFMRDVSQNQRKEKMVASSSSLNLAKNVMFLEFGDAELDLREI